MAKDPAFLFYSQDFYTGVATLSMEDRGKYISILCLMHQQGRMNEETIRLVVGSISVNLKSKFKVDENGLWYNERLEIEAEKRKNFTKSRRDNGLKGGRPKGKRKKKPIDKPNNNHMDNHMEDENDNEIEKEIYKKCVDFYFSYYQKIIGVKPAFDSGDGKHMKEMIGKIINSMKSNGKEVNQDTILFSFRVLYENLPKFYKSKLGIKTINSNYDTIIAEIRKGNKGNNGWAEFAHFKGWTNEA